MLCIIKASSFVRCVPDFLRMEGCCIVSRQGRHGFGRVLGLGSWGLGLGYARLGGGGGAGSRRVGPGGPADMGRGGRHARQHPRVGADPARFHQIVGKAIDYLARPRPTTAGQQPAGVGVTALVTTAMLRNGRTPSDPAVAKGLRFLEGFVQPDGGIYTPTVGLPATTKPAWRSCVSPRPTRDSRYDKIIQQRREVPQEDPVGRSARAKDRSDLFYGGAGYGKHKRPDLSNTQFLVDALTAAGNGPNDEAMQKALVFVSRCQNLESEHNTTPFAAKNPDGGFYYTLRRRRRQRGRQDRQRRAAELRLDDLRRPEEHDLRRRRARRPPRQGGHRVDPAALRPEDQPGHGRRRACTTTTTSSPRPWTPSARTASRTPGREARLAARAGRRSWPPGSAPTAPGSTEDDRWLEGDPNLVTGYALLALAYCRPGRD